MAIVQAQPNNANASDSDIVRCIAVGMGFQTVVAGVFYLDLLVAQIGAAHRPAWREEQRWYKIKYHCWLPGTY